MRSTDVINFTWRSLAFARVRTALMLLAMSIGVASVIVLSALGEGARMYVVDQFSSLGTNMLIVLPGRTETVGGSPANFLGETPRDLTIDDANALYRSPHIKHVAPVVVGAAPVSHNGLEREAVVFGSSYEAQFVIETNVSRGKYLPKTSNRSATPVCIIGATIKQELFKNKNALGEWLRIGDRRFRVIGILSNQGMSGGMDVDETVVIPVVSAQAVFNSPSLFRILVSASNRDVLDKAKQDILRIIKQRHQNEEDITVISQDAILSTFDRILKTLTLSVAGIAAISLAVAGVLIMNVMLIAVSQRTTEIGLFKALGSPPKQIQMIFLFEAIFLSLLGAILGLILGYVGTYFISGLFEEIQFSTPWWANLSAVIVASLTGIVFGILPAKRAAKLDPVIALYGR